MFDVESVRAFDFMCDFSVFIIVFLIVSVVLMLMFGWNLNV